MAPSLLKRTAAGSMKKTARLGEKESGSASRPPSTSKGIKAVDDRDGVVSSKSTKVNDRGEGVATKRKRMGAAQKETPAKKRPKVDQAEERGPKSVKGLSKEASGPNRTNRPSIKQNPKQHSSAKRNESSKSVKASMVVKASKKQSTTMSSQNNQKSSASKVVARAPSPPPRPSSASSERGHDEDEEGIAEPSESESHEEENVHLHGFSSDDDDSSVEDDGEHSAVDPSKLPTISKDDAAVKQRLEKAKRQPVRATICPISITRMINLLSDRPAWGAVPLSHPSWFLRGPTQGLLLSIRRDHPSPLVSKQKSTPDRLLQEYLDF